MSNQRIYQLSIVFILAVTLIALFIICTIYDQPSDSTTNAERELPTGCTSILEVHTVATGGDGTPEDPWTGWDDAIAASLMQDAICLHFSRGNYYQMASHEVVYEGMNDEGLHVCEGVRKH